MKLLLAGQNPTRVKVLRNRSHSKSHSNCIPTAFQVGQISFQLHSNFSFQRSSNCIPTSHSRSHSKSHSNCIPTSHSNCSGMENSTSRTSHHMLTRGKQPKSHTDEIGDDNRGEEAEDQADPLSRGHEPTTSAQYGRYAERGKC